ncbi:MAG: hypothetical protein R3D27_11515 [Hyphomicrobiaceae bacterium]
MTSLSRTTAVLLTTVALASAVTGCRVEEQDRPLEFTPGVYQGEKTKPLDDRQRRELRERGLLQQG